MTLHAPRPRLRGRRRRVNRHCEERLPATKQSRMPNVNFATEQEIASPLRGSQ